MQPKSIKVVLIGSIEIEKEKEGESRGEGGGGRRAKGGGRRGTAVKRTESETELNE